MNINAYVKSLVNYGKKQGLLEEGDEIYARNQILRELGLDEYEEPEDQELIPIGEGEAAGDSLEQILKGKTTTVAGPSGAGKSSLTNLLAPHVQMETGEISRKLGRGRHTTRHSQLIPIDGDTYLMDTPGFTSFYVEDMEKEELRYYFPEFTPYEGTCRFQGCTHTHEPGCKVKEALQ